MDILRQFGIILALAFVGEILHALLPLPIPASIYGILLLFVMLRFKVLHVVQIRETVTFLIETMPIMFVPAAAGLLNAWGIIKPKLIPYLIIIVVGMVVVMVVSGLTTQFIINHQKKKVDVERNKHVRIFNLFLVSLRSGLSGCIRYRGIFT